MTVTSAQLRQVAGELRGFAGSLGACAGSASQHIAGLSTAIDTVAGTWSGPARDGVDAAAKAYVGEVTGAPGLIEQMEETVTQLAAYAETVAADMAGWEARRATVDERRRAGTSLPDDSDSAWIAESHISGLANTWAYNAGWYALVLASDATALRRCCDTVAMSEGFAPPGPIGYYTMVAGLALEEGIALDVIDPTGKLDAAVISMIEDVQSGELGPFKFLVLEVMRQNNLDEQDMILGGGDLESAEFDKALDLWQQVNARYELGLDDTELELLAHQTVATALMLRAAPDELRDTLVIEQPTPDIDNIDTDDLWGELHEISTDFDGVGICLEANASGGPALAGGAGTCVVSTDGDLGQIAWHSIGGSVGSSAVSVGAGPISTNARNIGELEGWSVCFNGAAGSGVGGSGTMCGGLQFQADGTYTFNGVVSAQGSVDLTSPNGGGSVVLVRTYTVWRNGTLNVIREPFEAVGEGYTSIIDGFENLFRPPRFR